MEQVQASELVLTDRSASRARKVLTLRASGFSNAEIAESLGIPLSSVGSIIKRRLEDATDAARAEAIRAQELAKLDELEEVYFDAAVGGDLNCAGMTLDIMKQRSKITGIEKKEVVSNQNVSFSLVGILADMSNQEDREAIKNTKVIDHKDS